MLRKLTFTNHNWKSYVTSSHWRSPLVVQVSHLLSLDIRKEILQADSQLFQKHFQRRIRLTDFIQNIAYKASRSTPVEAVSSLRGAQLLPVKTVLTEPVNKEKHVQNNN